MTTSKAMTDDTMPLVLLRNVLGALLFAGLAVYFQREGNGAAAIFCLTTAGALFAHSGRSREKGGATSPGTAGLPMSALCLVLLATGCRPGADVDFALLRFTAGQPTYGAAAGSNSDYVRLTAQGSLPAACASPYGCLYYSSVDSLPHLVSAGGTEYAAGSAFRARQVAGTPGSVATGDLWHDTATGYLMWRSASGSIAIGNTGGWVTLDTSQTITGAKAFNGAVTLGDAAADAIAVKGALAIDNAANSFAVSLTSTVTANRAITFPDAAGALVLATNTATLTNKTLTAPVINGATAASGNFDLSGSSGTTKTTTGAVTIGPGAVGVTGDVTLTTTKTLAAGANTLISGDKLQAAQLAIGSQATGDLLYADSSTSWARLAAGTSGYPLLGGGAGFAPAYAQIGSTGISAGTLVYSTVSGGAKGALGAATGYLGGAGVALTTTVEVMNAVGTRTGTARTLYCLVGTAPGGADTVVFTARKSSTDQALTCTITGAATTCNDTTHTFAVAAGNPLSIKAASSAGTASDANCSFEVTN